MRGEPRDVDCENTCPAEWIYKCIRSAGHKGPHSDWTSRTWTDEKPRKKPGRKPGGRTWSTNRKEKQ